MAAESKTASRPVLSIGLDGTPSLRRGTVVSRPSSTLTPRCIRRLPQPAACSVASLSVVTYDPAFLSRVCFVFFRTRLARVNRRARSPTTVRRFVGKSSTSTTAAAAGKKDPLPEFPGLREDSYPLRYMRSTVYLQSSPKMAFRVKPCKGNEGRVDFKVRVLDKDTAAAWAKVTDKLREYNL